MGLPSREVDRQNEAVAVTDQVDLGAEAATRTPQRMVKRLLHLRRLAPAQPPRDAAFFFPPRRQPCWPG
jgi:hypothetical protein